MMLPQRVLELFALYTNANYKLYLIGGAVRDYILGKEVLEYDFTTDATPSESITLLSNYHLDTYQFTLGSIKVFIGDDIFEITTMRKEQGVSNLRYPEKIEFVKNLRDDVERRDFTINAIAYHPNEGFIDYLDGINDLHKKIIKFIGDPKTRIKEDPIRILRGLRFSHTLSFKIDQKTYTEMVNYAYLVKDLKQIRFEELYRISTMDNGFKFINEHLNIYCDAFTEIKKNVLSQIVTRPSLTNNQLKYAFFILFDHTYLLSVLNNFKLNKKEIRFVKELLTFEKVESSLINTKIMMNKYQENFLKILDIYSIIDEDYINKVMSYYQKIIDKKMCINKKDLKIDYNLLILNGVPKHKTSCAINYLFSKVLEDDSLNNEKDLINLINKNEEFID